MSATEELIRFLSAANTKGRRAKLNDTLNDTLNNTLDSNLGNTLADTSFTLLAGRELFDLRLALVCADTDDAIKLLKNSREGSPRLINLSSTAKNRPLAFLFTDWNIAAMHVAGAIFASQPVFRTEVERCISAVDVADAATARDWLWSLFDGRADQSLAQPSPETEAFVPIACFVFGYAMARLWQSLGLHADVLIGDGTGEFVAAHLAGCISLDDAIYLATQRGRSLQYGVMGGNSTELAAKIRSMVPSVPRIAYLSAMAGNMVELETLAHPEYWLTRVHQQIDLSPTSLAGMADRVVLDIGAGKIIEPALTPAPAADGVCWMLSTLGVLAVSGVKIDWRAYFADKIVRRISLPTYCFETSRHWFVAPEQTSVKPRPPAAVPPHNRNQIRTETPAPRPLHNRQVEKFLVETCQELLGIDSIGLHDNVMQLGMDSMNVMQLSLRIEQAFKLKIAPHHLFSKPHIGSVIEKILALRPDLASAPIADASVSASPAKPAAQIKTDNATDDDELAEMASFVNNLSDLEVNRLLMELNAS